MVGTHRNPLFLQRLESSGRPRKLDPRISFGNGCAIGLRNTLFEFRSVFTTLEVLRIDSYLLAIRAILR